jgi:hypothetical protein
MERSVNIEAVVPDVTLAIEAQAGLCACCTRPLPLEGIFADTDRRGRVLSALCEPCGNAIRLAGSTRVDQLRMLASYLESRNALVIARDIAELLEVP